MIIAVGTSLSLGDSFGFISDVRNVSPRCCSSARVRPNSVSGVGYDHDRQRTFDTTRNCSVKHEPYCYTVCLNEVDTDVDACT